jgi:perosamine synthetase
MAVHIYGLRVDMVPVISLAQQASAFHHRGRGRAAWADLQKQARRLVGLHSDRELLSKQADHDRRRRYGADEQHGAGRSLPDLRNLCFDKERRYIHEELGWNFRMSNVQPAIGVAQLERIDQIVAKKRQIGH